MTSPLDNLARTGQLNREPADAVEYAGLLRSGRVRLANAANASLSLALLSHPMRQHRALAWAAQTAAIPLAFLLIAGNIRDT